jgi:hypothetical protein
MPPRTEAGPAVRFDFIEPHTIARGAVVPFLQEFSLAPLLRESVMG